MLITFIAIHRNKQILTCSFFFFYKCKFTNFITIFSSLETNDKKVNNLRTEHGETNLTSNVIHIQVNQIYLSFDTTCTKTVCWYWKTGVYNTPLSLSLSISLIFAKRRGDRLGQTPCLLLFPILKYFFCMFLLIYFPFSFVQFFL